MAYLTLEDFKGGLDRRRMTEASAPGSLRTLKNAHINRGGEIEKSKAWVTKYILPNGVTKGFAANNQLLYVFGHTASPTIPSGVNYQQLASPDANAMVSVDYQVNFAGKMYAIATYVDGKQHHFYNGSVVTDWDDGTVVTGGKRAVSAMSHKNKIYVPFGVNVIFCGIADPTKWDTVNDTGCGVIDMSAQAQTNEEMTALGVYQGRLVAFTRNTNQSWLMDADPVKNNQIQTLDNVGTLASKAIRNFGDSDVFFLSGFGYRSLRPRDASNNAGITDVGAPIDDVIISELATMSDAQIALSCSAIEPDSGRYISSLNGKMYVFSFFQASKISSWSTWEPGFNITDFATSNGRLYGRAGENIYLLGGDSNDQYTAEQVIVETPYLDAKSIATWKRWKGLDFVGEGEWDVYVNTSPRFPDEWVKTATVTRTSMGQMNMKMQEFAEFVKFKFVHQGAGIAKISKLVVHYDVSRVQ